MDTSKIGGPSVHGVKAIDQFIDDVDAVVGFESFRCEAEALDKKVLANFAWELEECTRLHFVFLRRRSGTCIWFGELAGRYCCC